MQIRSHANPSCYLTISTPYYTFHSPATGVICIIHIRGYYLGIINTPNNAVRGDPTWEPRFTKLQYIPTGAEYGAHQQHTNTPCWVLFWCWKWYGMVERMLRTTYCMFQKYKTYPWPPANRQSLNLFYMLM